MCGREGGRKRGGWRSGEAGKRGESLLCVCPTVREEVLPSPPFHSTWKRWQKGGCRGSKEVAEGWQRGQPHGTLICPSYTSPSCSFPVPSCIEQPIELKSCT